MRGPGRWTRREFLVAGAATAAGACVLPARRAEPAGAAAGAAGVGVGRTPLQRKGASVREQLSLDWGWRFQLGDAANPSHDFDYGVGRMFAKSGDLFAPSSLEFDDRGWRAVDLPHDWAVGLPFRENVEELIEFGSKPLGRAYPETSIGWYRKVLNVPAEDAGRRLVVRFDGVFRDAMVALNGHFLGRNLSGYAPFEYDVSDIVDYGKPNVLVVRVDATGREGWFYEGAGIYRHVWLSKTGPLHVARWGTFVTSELGRGGGVAKLRIATTVENDRGEDAAGAQIVQTVLDPSGRAVGEVRSQPLVVGARGRAEVVQELDVRAPALWSIETPALYTLLTRLERDGAVVDEYGTSFGIRTLRFDAAKGFFLNDAHVVLQGTCNHQDHAGVGVALPDRLHAYRIERLKAMGSNAYRTAHNPPAPELLAACDRLGMLVLDETRLFTPTEEGQSQLERLILRDRNHPSVFCWAIANEEWADQGNERGARIAATLTALAHRLDPSRPVTAAMDGGWGSGISGVVDVQGCNYERPKNPESNLDSFHERFPSQPMMGTEVASTYCTRGVYAIDKDKGYVPAYDQEHPGYGATAEAWWNRFAARPHIAGGFVWTGFDYRGEPSPYQWPCISSHFGIMDTCGFAKDNYFYYQAWWGKEPVLHVFPHWNWGKSKEGQEIDVWVHSNLAKVELLLNGRSLGAKPVERWKHLAWKVPYAPGVLTARGMDASGRVVLEARRETTGAPARIVLAADRTTLWADGQDLSVVTVSVVDAEGRQVPTAEDSVTFAVSGAGKLIGVGNGDPSSHESDQGTSRRLFGGLCAAFVQAQREPGVVHVAASAPGLAGAALEITCEAVALPASG